MSINLQKTENKGINLTKTVPAMTKVKAVLWWDTPKSNPNYDLDVSAFVLKSTDSGPKLIGDEYLVFYNNESTPEGSVKKTPDMRSGGSEEVVIDIPGLPANADEISFVVTIHEAIKRGQSFGQVPEAGIKILNAETGDEIAFYDLDAEFKNETAVQVGSFFKQNGEFTFQAIGTGFEGLELGDFVSGYQ
jgi:tellurium resistance protein TerD